MRALFTALAITISTPVLVSAQQCGDPPRVDDQSLKGELEGKAKFLSGRLGDAGLKGQIETARTDVLSKYPNADKVRINASLLYMLCNIVLNDSKLTAQEKFRMMLEFQQSLGTSRSE